MSQCSYVVLSVLLKGRGCHSGGHFGGVADYWSEKAARGEDHGEEDVRFFFAHYQGTGGQHGSSG